MNVVSAIRATVPISELNRGQASKIFREVRDSGPKVVMKNNEAEAVILSPEDYVQLIDDLEDAELEALAAYRLANMDESKLIPAEKLYAEVGITEADLEGWEDIEIE